MIWKQNKAQRQAACAVDALGREGWRRALGGARQNFQVKLPGLRCSSGINQTHDVRQCHRFRRGRRYSETAVKIPKMGLVRQVTALLALHVFAQLVFDRIEHAVEPGVDLVSVCHAQTCLHPFGPDPAGAAGA